MLHIFGCNPMETGFLPLKKKKREREQKTNFEVLKIKLVKIK